MVVNDKSLTEIEQIQLVVVIHPQAADGAGDVELGVVLEQLHGLVEQLLFVNLAVATGFA